MKKVLLTILVFTTAFLSSTKCIAQYDISTAVYQSVALNLISQDFAPKSIIFNGTGSKLYMLGNEGDDINEYTLSTPFEISTATFSKIALDISGQETWANSIKFNNNGTKLYVMGRVGDDINEYSMTTPYDVSTATFSKIALSNIPDEEPLDMFFNNTGSKLYVIGDLGKFFEYSLSTPYDIATAIYNGIALSIGFVVDVPISVLFNGNGSTLYVLGFQNRYIYEYSLSTPYDLATASYTQIALTNVHDSSPECMLFNNVGTKLYILGGDGYNIDQFGLSSIGILNNEGVTEGLSVYHSNGAIHVNLPLKVGGSFNVSIFNVLGQNMFNTDGSILEAKNEELRIETGHLSNGFYVVQVTLVGEAYSQKIYIRN